MKVLTIDVINKGYGSSLNLLTENHNTLKVIVDYDTVDLASLKSCNLYNDALIYVERILWGESHDYLKPLHDKPNTVGAMYGGNYGRFEDGTILKIHDRYETQEEYDMYSR